jgi:hypothetical protein
VAVRIFSFMFESFGGGERSKEMRKPDRLLRHASYRTYDVTSRIHQILLLYPSLIHPAGLETLSVFRAAGRRVGSASRSRNDLRPVL